VSLDLGPVTSTYWGLQHGVLPPALAQSARFPMRFTGLMVSECNVKGARRSYLESITFYTRNRRPLTISSDPTRRVPVSEDGVLPTPPAGVQTRTDPDGGDAVRFVSESPAGVLSLRVDPTRVSRGCHGSLGQWT